MGASKIRNKIKRQDIFRNGKLEKSKAKLAERKQRAHAEKQDPNLKEVSDFIVGFAANMQERLKTNIPATLENQREYDETIVTDHDDQPDFANDEFASFFNNSTATPKLLITTSHHPSLSGPTHVFASDLLNVFPGSTFRPRGRTFLPLQKLAAGAAERGFTDMLVINEERSRKKIDAITLIHLPSGPSCRFRVSSVETCQKISGHGNATSHLPELILNNFTTMLGVRVARFFHCLLPKQPEFHGRQVVTLHNQRDFIFFRRHRYVFKDGWFCQVTLMVVEKVGLQELGPRFTMKLLWIKRGIAGTGEESRILTVGKEEGNGEVEWEWRPELETSKRKFFL
jgi:ribosome production factor 1